MTHIDTNNETTIDAHIFNQQRLINTEKLQKQNAN